jgi:hypothetical protein
VLGSGVVSWWFVGEVKMDLLGREGLGCRYRLWFGSENSGWYSEVNNKTIPTLASVTATPEMKLIAVHNWDFRVEFARGSTPLQSGQ